MGQVKSVGMRNTHHRQAGVPDTLVEMRLETDAAVTRRYAELTTDFNPIHLDEEFARATSFGNPIIHGTLGLNLLVSAIERTFGDALADCRIDVRFIRPVPVGATVVCGGTLSDREQRAYQVFVRTEDGECAVEGTCTVDLT